MKVKIPYCFWYVLAFLLLPQGKLYSQGDSLNITLDCPINLDSMQVNSQNYNILVNTGTSFYSLPPPSDRTSIDNTISIPYVLSADSNLNKSSIDFVLVAEGCLTKKITYTLDTALSTDNQWHINSFYGESYKVQYPSTLCDYSGPISPVTDLPIHEIVFSSANGSLSMGDNGQINVQNTVPGSYQINMKSSYCLETYSKPITIIAKPDFNLIEKVECDRTRLQLQINNVETPSVSWSDSTTGVEKEVFESKKIWTTVTNEYGCSSTDSIWVEVKKMVLQSQVIDKQESDCWTDGMVNVRSATVINNVGDYSYRLKNTINGSIVDRMEQVPAGEYNLQVIDSRNCTADAPEKLTVIQKCLEDYPVFTPNSDGVEDQYFIPYQGRIKIYDSENRLVKELESPNYWDGTDQTGLVLPMGNYVMVTDQGRPVNITIVR